MRYLRQLGTKLKLLIAALRRRKMRLFAVVFLVVVLGLLATVGTAAVLNRLLGESFFSWPQAAILTSERLDLVKVALLVAGGIGGAVALTVSYRKQEWAEGDLAGKRSAYAAAAAQLGDPSPTVRLAGIYALANLADAWPEQRQQCVDVLCGHLRIPWTPESRQRDEIAAQEKPMPLAPAAIWGETQVRETILTVIADHLHPAQALPAGISSWSPVSLNLTDALIPDWKLDGCAFSGTLKAQNLRLLPNHQLTLRWADLTGANLSEADLTGVSLTGTNLTKVNLTGANLTRSNLAKANLTKANLFRTKLDDANLIEANLKKAILVVAYLAGTDLFRVNLSGANLTRAELTGANLSRSNLSRANLFQANLTGAKLTEANLTKVNMSRADVAKANLTKANLTKATMLVTDLSGANLTRANLTGADLTEANLTGADLTEANLTGANLSEANLTGANLSEAIRRKHEDK